MGVHPERVNLKRGPGPIQSMECIRTRVLVDIQIEVDRVLVVMHVIPGRIRRRLLAFIAHQAAFVDSYAVYVCRGVMTAQRNLMDVQKGLVAMNRKNPFPCHYKRTAHPILEYDATCVYTSAVLEFMATPCAKMARQALGLPPRCECGGVFTLTEVCHALCVRCAKRLFTPAE